MSGTGPERQDDGGSFLIREAFTLTYGMLLPKFYRSTATSGLGADCGVSVMDGVVEVGLRCRVLTPHCLRPRPSFLE